MIVIAIESGAVPANVNILLWDAIEEEWRIGAKRRLLNLDQYFWIACCMADADDLIGDDQPVPVFESVTHWAALPPAVGGVA